MLILSLEVDAPPVLIRVMFVGVRGFLHSHHPTALVKFVFSDLVLVVGKISLILMISFAITHNVLGAVANGRGVVPRRRLPRAIGVDVATARAD